jgi:hypothetical protein
LGLGVAPDRAALRSGAGGLALVGLSVVPWGRLAGRLLPGPAEPWWGWPLFVAISVTGFCFAVFAVWSAIKAWLRFDVMSTEARWGLTLGAAAIVLVVAIGPCGGPVGCP